MKLVDLERLVDDGLDFVGFMNMICETLDVDYASYAALGLLGDAVQGFANYPDSWKQHYAQQGFAQHDPILHLASRSIAPIDWSMLRENEGFKKVFHDAADFGISSRGITVPVRGPNGDVGLFSVTSSRPEAEWQALREDIIFDLQSIAVHFHDAVIKSQAATPALVSPVLSRRETEILQWTAAGKSHQDISDILGISHRTVEVHLRSSRTKLGALTTPQAIGRAIGHKLIKAG